MEKVNVIWVFVAFIVVPFVGYIMYEVISDNWEKIKKSLFRIATCIFGILAITAIIWIFFKGCNWVSHPDLDHVHYEKYK